MDLKVVKAIILVKLDTGNVHEAVIDQEALRNFLLGYTYATGEPLILGPVIEGVDLIEHKPEPIKENSLKS